MIFLTNRQTAPSYVPARAWVPRSRCRFWKRMLPAWGAIRCGEEARRPDALRRRVRAARRGAGLLDPESSGPGFKFPYIYEPLEPFRKYTSCSPAACGRSPRRILPA